MKQSRERLQRLGYFEEVNIETPAVAGSADEVDVNVAVVEKDSGSLLAGIGFTMSLFVAGLGFSSSAEHLNIAKTSVLFASLVAGICGYLWLRFRVPK